MKANDTLRHITFAAAQMESADGDVRANLTHATTFVDKAADAGAQLLVFPEFMPQGFRLTQALWDAGEPQGGPTEQWLVAQALRTGMHIGTSYLRAAGGHFYNTFALAAPDGRIAGRVDKENPSLWEAYFFTGGHNGHVIDTALGRVGVGICFDNHTFAVAEAVRAAQVDLMVMPHSYFVPDVTGKLFSNADMARSNGLPAAVAALYNRTLGIPVLMANKSGPWAPVAPTKLFPLMESYRFSGRSAILGAGGEVLAALGDSEGLAVAEVALQKPAAPAVPFAHYSRYLYPGSAGREYIRFVEWMGRGHYRRSALRRQKALAAEARGLAAR